MSRDLTSATSTALQQRVVRPVLIVRLDFATDPITAWNGPGIFAPSGSGDAALDGQTFTRVDAVVELSPIKEDQGIGEPVVLTATAHDLDEEALRQVVRDKRAWRGKPAYIWVGLMDSDHATVISDPFRAKTGVMTQMKVMRTAEESVIQITIDDDLSNSRSAPWRWIDHTRTYASDTWSVFVTLLANKPNGLGASDVMRVSTPLTQDMIDRIKEQLRQGGMF